MVGYVMEAQPTTMNPKILMALCAAATLLAACGPREAKQGTAEEPTAAPVSDTPGGTTGDTSTTPGGVAGDAAATSGATTTPESAPPPNPEPPPKGEQ